MGFEPTIFAFAVRCTSVCAFPPVGAPQPASGARMKLIRESGFEPPFRRTHEEIHKTRAVTDAPARKKVDRRGILGPDMGCRVCATRLRGIY